MFPRSDSRDALLALQRKQELDPRLSTSDPNWLADHLYDYFAQRDSGATHDQALKTVLTGADLTLGSPAPVPIPVPKPEPAIQPLEDLKPAPKGFTETRNSIKDGRDVREDHRWVWKGVYVPGAFKQFLSAPQTLELVLVWAQSLGANTLVATAPDDPNAPEVQAFVSLVSSHCLRMYWEGMPVTKPVTPPGVVTTVEDGPGKGTRMLVPGKTPPRQPLDAPSVISLTGPPPPVYTPASPDMAFWAGAASVWESGGGTLDAASGRPTEEEAQRIAEWFFRGLSVIPPDTQDWTPVSPGPGFPVVHDKAWGEALGRVNGQQAMVLIINPAPDRVFTPQAPWRIVAVTGPSYSLMELRS